MGYAMRIIGGKLRGREVEAPRGLLSRPPLSIIREAVFDIIGEAIEGKTVLDLFAGSGSLGIEALSRGAGQVHFVDSARRCIEMLEHNTRNLDLEDHSRITRQDAVEFVRTWKGGAFDIVFVDPPFLSGKVGEVLSGLAGTALVSDRTLIVARVHWREQVSPPQDLHITRKRKFGDSLVLFIRRPRQGTCQ